MKKSQFQKKLKKLGNLKVNATKAFLSLFLVFHLSAVVLAPNCQTYLGKVAAPLFEPYLNFFEFMASWSFFAPDPGPPPVFIEWESVDKNSTTLESNRWPILPNPYFFRERQNR